MELADILSVIGLSLTGFGLFYAGMQLRDSRKVSKSQFMLELYKIIDEHNELHLELTKQGFANGTFQPRTDEEWLRIGRLMGLFEHINSLEKSGIIDIRTIDKLYSYRIIPLVKNEHIYDKHIDPNTKSWLGFKELLYKLDEQPNFKEMNTNYSLKS